MPPVSETKIFLSTVPKPNKENLSVALGPSLVFYNQLLFSTVSYKNTWNHSKSSGWMLKISDGKKALCYVSPLTGCYRISLTLRPAERDLLLQDTTLTSLKQEMETACKFVEGYALQFIVSNKKEHERFMNLLHALMLLGK